MSQPNEITKRSLARELLTAGPKAPLVLAKAAVEAVGKDAGAYAKKITGQGVDVDELVSSVIQAHRALARTEGGAAGLAVSVAEMTSIVGSAGTLTVPAAAVTLTGDLVGLAWIQVRMVLIIAALHGHDPEHADRVQELLTLNGLYGAGTAGTATAAATAGGQRVGKRLLTRHLKGDALKTLTQLFRFVGVKFSRAGLIRALPLVNIPVNVAVNDRATHALGRKAVAYYKRLPSGA